MDAETIKILLEKNPSLGPAAIVVLMWAAKALYNNFKDKDDKRESALIALNQSLHENTLAIVKLTTQMEFLHDSVKEIPELRKDVDGVGEKIRKLQKESGT